MWPAHCFAELLELTGDEGRQMLTKYEEKVRIIEDKPEELKDIDSKRDLRIWGKKRKKIKSVNKRKGNNMKKSCIAVIAVSPFSCHVWSQREKRYRKRQKAKRRICRGYGTEGKAKAEEETEHEFLLRRV